MKIKTFPTLINQICYTCEYFLDCYRKHQNGQRIECETVVETPDKFKEKNE